MRSKLTSAVALSLVVFGQNAFAQERGAYYAKVFGGVSSLQGDTFTFGATTSGLNYDSGASFGGAFGYDYADSPFRAEVEFNYRSGDATDIPLSVGTQGDFASTSLMLNGYYVFDTASAWRPYVGLGLGFLTEVDFDIEGMAGDTEFNDRGGIAAQLMLGVEYPVSDRFAVFAEARYFTAGSVDLESDAGGTLSADYDTFDINIGGAFRF